MRRILLATIALSVLATDSKSQTQPTNWDRIFWVETITPQGEVLLREYHQSATHTLLLPHLEIWPQKVDTIDPMKRMFWQKPDLTLELIRNGYARLLDERSASLVYQESEMDAKAAARGLWQTTDAVDNSAVDNSDPLAPSLTTDSPSLWSIIERLSDLYGGLGALIATLVAIAGVIWQLLRRRRVPLLFLGSSSSGKTWLWARIRNPEISFGELKTHSRTDVTMRDVALQSEPMGRYEVRPIYVDTPGGQPGWQVNELIRRRWRLFQKSVWVILLSTTRLNTARRSSPQEEKIDQDYISEQLGYLYLPLGMLAAPKTPKPSLVIAVISKFDLFSEQEPSSPEGERSKEILSSLFARHLSMLEEECVRTRIPYKLEYCSALEGWKTDNISRHIKNALFSRLRNA